MPISVTCAACSRPINAADELSGRKVRCPQCGNVVAIPAVAVANPSPRVPVDLARAITSAPEPVASQPVHADNLNRNGTPAPNLIPLEPVELEVAEPEPEPGRPGIKKRRKKKKRIKAPLPDGLTPWIAAYWPFMLGLVVAGFVWLVLLGISLLSPDLVLLVFIYGAAVFWTGMIWLYFQALMDGFELLTLETRGMGAIAGAIMFVKLLLIPVTGVIYFVFNIAEAWRAGVLVIFGVLIVASGVMVLMVVV